MELLKKLLSVISLIFSIYLSSPAFGGFTKGRLFPGGFFWVGKALSDLLFVRKISNNCRISPSLLNHLSKISEHASPCLCLCLSKERDASRWKRIANTFTTNGRLKRSCSYSHQKLTLFGFCLRCAARMKPIATMIARQYTPLSMQA